MTTVHAVYTTTDLSWWQRVAPILGFSPTGEPGRYTGGGQLTVHETTEATAAGTTHLDILVTDPSAALATAETVATVAEPAVGATDGTTITVSPAVEDSPTPTLASGQTQVAIMPIWYGPDPDEPTAILTGLGLQPRLASDSGNWKDFTADGGGQVAWHRAPSVALELALEHSGDLDALSTRLSEAGVRATVVDEAYNRTLLVQIPDGHQLWVNGTQDDLYGYHCAG
ncbi:hypothetical protein [Ruania zhangjianzhongii]|uniref:hypothetical protein n=1 Tax=Ruania zhangjianzhongii TaxID=2603206 RepID=UPI0011CB525F|nr:hypothetical protein [Ruania zhangjianzhongii]